jgi:hypothetical protein
MDVKPGPVTFKEERELRVYKNRVLRTIFGLNRAEIMGGWRKLCNEDLQSL